MEPIPAVLNFGRHCLVNRFRALHGIPLSCSRLGRKTNMAVILTGAILIWYTWETMLLRRVAVGQRELQLRPFVVFQKANGGYVVENLGSSAAPPLCGGE